MKDELDDLRDQVDRLKAEKDEQGKAELSGLLVKQVL